MSEEAIAAAEKILKPRQFRVIKREDWGSVSDPVVHYWDAVHALAESLAIWDRRELDVTPQEDEPSDAELKAAFDALGLDLLGSLRNVWRVGRNRVAAVSTSTSKENDVRPRLLDLFCCAGGAAMGYHRAGFDVVGVDIAPQPNYPFEFHQTDAIGYLLENGARFDAIHTSPPCQRFTRAQRLQGNEHPDFIEPIRDILEGMFSETPWVIENVVGAPLLEPVMLCGSMFPGLMVYRHRLFESNQSIHTPEHPAHTHPLRKMGRKPDPGDYMHVVGNFSGIDHAKRAMGIDWMSRNEMSEAIPPAYTEFIGAQLMEALADAAVSTSTESEHNDG